MVPSWSLVPKLMSIDHPWRMNKFDVGQSSLSWNSCGSLKRTMPTPLRSAKSRYASNESTLTPLEINSRLFTTYMFRFPSHHVFTWQATTWKKIHCRFHLYLFRCLWALMAALYVITSHWMPQQSKPQILCLINILCHVLNSVNQRYVMST